MSTFISIHRSGLQSFWGDTPTHVSQNLRKAQAYTCWGTAQVTLEYRIANHVWVKWTLRLKRGGTLSLLVQSLKLVCFLYYISSWYFENSLPIGWFHSRTSSLVLQSAFMSYLHFCTLIRNNLLIGLLCIMYQLTCRLPNIYELLKSLYQGQCMFISEGVNISLLKEANVNKWVFYLLICKSIYNSSVETVIQQIATKSSFGFFSKMQQKNLNELFGQHNICTLVSLGRCQALKIWMGPECEHRTGSGNIIPCFPGIHLIHYSLIFSNIFAGCIDARSLKITRIKIIQMLNNNRFHGPLKCDCPSISTEVP